MLESELTKLLIRSDPTPGPREGCLGEMQIAAFVDGTLAEPPIGSAIEHLADCNWCTQRVGAISSALASDLTATSFAVPKRANDLLGGERRGPSVRYLAAAAAVIALVSGAVGWRLSELHQVPPQVREAVRVVDERPGVEILVPTRQQVLLGSSRLLNWSPVAESVGYTVTVLLEDGEELWSAEVDGTAITIPTDVEIAPGRTHFVQVRAHLPDGRSLRSGHVELRAMED